MECAVSFTTRSSGGSHPSVRVRPGTTLLAAVRRAGLALATGCGAAASCARCGLRIRGRASRESPEEREAKARNRIDPELRLACRTRVEGDLLVTADYW